MMKSLFLARQRIVRLSLTTAVSSTASYRTAAMASQRVLRVQPALPSRIFTRFQSTAAARSVEPIPKEEEDVEKDNDDPKAVHTPFTSVRSSLSPNTYRAITVEPFKHTHMTPVQHSVMNHIDELIEPYDSKKDLRRDLLVKAKTGTGKTLAFLVPAIEARLKQIEKIGEEVASRSGAKITSPIVKQAMRSYAEKNVGTLIISPTRELAIQIAVEAEKLSWHHHMDVGVFVGGESKGMQLRNFWKNRKDIIVTTPGRLNDVLANVPNLKEAFENLNTLILDEADTLLDMGFRADIERIVDQLPQGPQRQTFLFSATVSPAIKQIAELSLQPNHRFINCVREDDSPVHAHIPQYTTNLSSPKEYMQHIMNLLAHDQLLHPGNSKIMLFFNTTRSVQLWSAMLMRLRDSLPSGRDTQIFELSSRKSMEQRRRTSDAFRRTKESSSILVTSDVSARGVDYPGVTRVIQVGVPANPDQYIHRVGRTGRGSNRVGRGDLVLLPHEEAYPRRHLSEVPLKDIPVSELEKELNEMVEAYESDPRKFVKDNNPSSKLTRPVFPKGVQDRIGTIDESIDVIRSKHDAEQVEDTFRAELGYLAGRTTDLRVSSEEVIEAMNGWCKDAMGVNPPTLNPSFLAKIGLGPSSRGRTFSRSPRQGYSQNYESRSPRAFDRYGSKPFRDGERREGSKYRGGERNSSFSGRRDGSRFDGERRGSFSDRRSPKFDRY